MFKLKISITIDNQNSDIINIDNQNSDIATLGLSVTYQHNLLVNFSSKNL